MDDHFVERRLTLVSNNPFISKEDRSSAPNPLKLASFNPTFTRDDDFELPSEIEEQKAKLIENLLKHLKIRKITPFGHEALEEVINYGFDFSDPDWQKDIKIYYDIAEELESTIGMIRDHGREYFKNGIVPPSVYTTALIMEYGQENPVLPYAEAKISCL